MIREREASYLHFKDYQIDNNSLRAFYDNENKLVFVLDNTITDIKPNVMLVMNPVADRKWDDILSNDYNVDLETVRPKKDNKYQKLDVEYSGLGAYENLINAFMNKSDLTDALALLQSVRNVAMQRSAPDRLETAESNAEKSRETIVKTNQTISELQVKLRQLRAKLTQQKNQVGKEPTKQSASKILRTEAQIDAINEKLGRAKKRLANAQKRLVAADEDAETARGILALLDSLGSMESKKYEQNVNLPVKQERGDVVIKKDAPVPVRQNEHIEKNVQISNNVVKETKAEKMADEEVKPLFDKDPEILDEELAFKPIDFGSGTGNGVQSVAPTTNVSDMQTTRNNDVALDSTPLSFTPPVSSVGTDANNSMSQQDNQRTDNVVPENRPAPVLDAIKPVEMPNVNTMPETPDDNFQVTPSVKDAPVSVSPVSSNPAPVAPVSGIAPAARPQAPSVAGGGRPVSPITGSGTTMTPVPRKPTVAYYVLLILLIALSIFTLWLYQQRGVKSEVPDLAPTVQQTEPEVVAEKSAADEMESPFIQPVAQPNQQVDEQQQVVQQDMGQPEQPMQTPEQVTVVEEETVVQEQEVMAPAEDTSMNVPESDTIQPTVVPEYTAPAPVVPTEDEVIASKPAYNVSQNENMFVADEAYETDEQFYAEEQTVNEGQLCPDGTSPDVNGCCTGEVYTDMGSAGFNCCPSTGGDCFAPLF